MNISKTLEKYVYSAPCFVFLNGKRYYFKIVEDEGHELVGDKLANICGINTTSDKIVLVNNEYYYLSYDLNNDGVYKDAGNMGITNLNLYDIWIMLEQTYAESSKKLMEQLIRIFIFDSILMFDDRYMFNFGVLSKGKKKDFYILDNEMILNGFYDLFLKAKFSSEDKLDKYTDLDLAFDDMPDNMKSNLEMFEYFIATLGSEQYPLVLDIYYKLTPDVIEEALLEVHYEYNDVLGFDEINEDLDLYKVNYECITKILIERGLINGQRIH